MWANGVPCGELLECAGAKGQRRTGGPLWYPLPCAQQPVDDGHMKLTHYLHPDHEKSDTEPCVLRPGNQQSGCTLSPSSMAPSTAEAPPALSFRKSRGSSPLCGPRACRNSEQPGERVTPAHLLQHGFAITLAYLTRCMRPTTSRVAGWIEQQRSSAMRYGAVVGAAPPAWEATCCTLTGGSIKRHV